MREKIIDFLNDLIIPKKSRRPIDLTLVSMVFFLLIFGLIMIYSASSYEGNIEGTSATHYVRNQTTFALMAFGIMIAVSFIDYHFILKYAPLIYFLSIGLLVFVLFFGHSAKGQARWIRIGGFNFQPSELAKMAMIILLAVFLTNMQETIDSWKGWVIVAILLSPIVFFVQFSNLSTAIIIILISMGMMFMSSKKPILYITLLGLGLLGLYLVYRLYPVLSGFPIALKAYQMNRIKVWINPNAYADEGGKQVLDALYAIGSGGPLGRGLGGSIKKRYGMSEAHNDMIFAIVVEEWGLLGAIILILVYLFLLYRIARIARNASDKYGLLLAGGVMVHIAIQIILNIMVATNSMPNTGVSLPFISYGGTSLMALMIEMGMVLGVQRKR